MKKPSRRDSLNLFFSAFLVIAFIICAHFFSQIISTLSPTAGSIITIVIYTVFGLLLFYATRVSDGKAVFRFSLLTLIVLVVPSLYIIIASLAPGLPFNSVFSAGITGKTTLIVTLASVALGYAIPYTFVSGFETAIEEKPEVKSNESIEENPTEEAQSETEDKADEEIQSEDENIVDNPSLPAES